MKLPLLVSLIAAGPVAFAVDFDDSDLTSLLVVVGGALALVLTYRWNVKAMAAPSGGDDPVRIAEGGTERPLS